MEFLRISMVFLGFSMVFLVFSMVFLWISMVFLGFSMGFRWISMVFLCLSMVFLGFSYGFPWFSYAFPCFSYDFRTSPWSPGALFSSPGPDGSELRYYGRRGGRDAEMRRWAASDGWRGGNGNGNKIYFLDLFGICIEIYIYICIYKDIIQYNIIK